MIGGMHSFIIIHLSCFVDAIVTDIRIDSVVTDPQYATIDQLHKVVPVSVKIPKILPVAVKDLAKYVLDCHNNGDEELKNQYQVDYWHVLHSYNNMFTNYYSHTVII